MQRQKIAVLRANALGDFIFALPALQALRTSFPHYEIVYLGRKMHQDLMAGRPGPVDRVVVVPPYPGVGEKETYVPDAAQVDAFFHDMQQEQFEIAIQLHGGGANSNPFLKKLGARLNVGLQAPGAPPLDINVPYITYFSETLRFLEVVSAIGAGTMDIRPRLTVTDEDIAEIAKVLPELNSVPYVMVHASASDKRRHWPAARFARVADFFGAKGYRVCFNGLASEYAIVENIIRQMQYAGMACNLSGQLSIKGLVGLVAMARLIVSNDSGPLHVAHALEIPAVGIYWAGNMITGSPVACRYSRPLISWTSHCPLCGMHVQHLNNRPSDCRHDTSFVADVQTEEVLAAVQDLLERPYEKQQSCRHTAKMYVSDFLQEKAASDGTIHTAN